MNERPVLAVLGGSFDPPHLSHVLIPTWVLARGLAERVLVAPCFRHPLDKALSPFETRLAWTRAAMSVHADAVSVTDLERELGEASGRPSYTLELMQAVARANPRFRVRLIVGSDIVESGETSRWHRWSDLEREFEPIIVPRAGVSASNGEPAALPKISGREVRALLDEATDSAGAAGLAARVPARVLAMIERKAGMVHVVGHGNAATHAERWLGERGFRVETVAAGALVAGRAVLAVGRSDGVWLLGRDPDLPGLASSLAREGLPPSLPILHGAGALRAHDVLGPLADAGHPVGTLHPICALRREHPARWLEHATFGVEGDPAAREFATRLVGTQPWLDLQGLDGRRRVAYHAACSLAANHLAVIEDSAAKVLVAQGFSRVQVDRALGILLRSALDNLLALGIPAGVTGPVARGDELAVARHLGALPEPAAGLYRTLSERLRALLS